MIADGLCTGCCLLKQRKLLDNDKHARNTRKCNLQIALCHGDIIVVVIVVLRRRRASSCHKNLALTVLQRERERRSCDVHQAAICIASHTPIIDCHTLYTSFGATDDDSQSGGGVVVCVDCFLMQKNKTASSWILGSNCYGRGFF